MIWVVRFVRVCIECSGSQENLGDPGRKGGPGGQNN